MTELHEAPELDDGDKGLSLSAEETKRLLEEWRDLAVTQSRWIRNENSRTRHDQEWAKLREGIASAQSALASAESKWENAPDDNPCIYRVNSNKHNYDLALADVLYNWLETIAPKKDGELTVLQEMNITSIRLNLNGDKELKSVTLYGFTHSQLYANLNIYPGSIESRTIATIIEPPTWWCDYKKD